MLAEEVLGRAAHYLRLRPAQDGHTNAVIGDVDAAESGGLDKALWSSVHTVWYTLDRVFETIPEGVQVAERLDRGAMAVMEADLEPALSNALPYDHHLFVLSVPQERGTVFRSSEATAAALQDAMLDSGSFAAEMFGLPEDDEIDELLGDPKSPELAMMEEQFKKIDRLLLDEDQIRHFLDSPLGAEVAARVQLQPAYHSLVQADVVVANYGTDTPSDSQRDCYRRLERMLTELRQRARHCTILLGGNLEVPHGTLHHRLVHTLSLMLSKDTPVDVDVSA